jgi:hypothetical protein
MREVPRDIHPDVVIELGRLLDAHPRTRPVSVIWLIDEMRRNFGATGPTDALERLAVEMAAARHLPIMLDRPTKQQRQR